MKILAAVLLAALPGWLPFARFAPAAREPEAPATPVIPEEPERPGEPPEPPPSAPAPRVGFDSWTLRAVHGAAVGRDGGNAVGENMYRYRLRGKPLATW